MHELLIFLLEITLFIMGVTFTPVEIGDVRYTAAPYTKAISIIMECWDDSARVLCKNVWNMIQNIVWICFKRGSSMR